MFEKSNILREKKNNNILRLNKNYNYNGVFSFSYIIFLLGKNKKNY